MGASTIIFYLLAAITLGSAFLSVSTRNIFRAAIYLLFTLIGIAGIYFWMAYDFIAAVQIIVYAGGISVLIIFSIFLTQQAGELLPVQHTRRKLFSFLAAVIAFILIIMQLIDYAFVPVGQGSEGPTVMEIGQAMMGLGKGGYALAFEVISILLLAAMVACIVIAIRQKPDPLPAEETDTITIESGNTWN